MFYKWGSARQNQQNACAPSEDSYQPMRAQWVTKDPNFLHADAQADLSSLGAHAIL